MTAGIRTAGIGTAGIAKTADIGTAGTAGKAGTAIEKSWNRPCLVGIEPGSFHYSLLLDQNAKSKFFFEQKTLKKT